MATGNENAEHPDARLKRLLGPIRSQVDQALRNRAISWRGPAILVEAMEYAVFSGGKRIRPALTLACCEAVGGSAALAEPAACALELVHAYSLVHDDLPAMDDDVERRGMPTVHIKYGEAMAVLAGDALLTEAFAMVAEPVAAPEHAWRRLRCSEVLARCAGQSGMVGGQVKDIQIPEPEVEAILDMHAGKTGALFLAAGQMGAICAGVEPEIEQKMAVFGALVGKAFQVSDDIIDALELEDQPDEHEEGVNIVSLLGLEGAADLTATAVAEARTILAEMPVQPELLVAVADWIDDRARAYARYG